MCAKASRGWVGSDSEGFRVAIFMCVDELLRIINLYLSIF